MSLWVAVLILAACEAAAVALMLVVRRRSPAGSFFKDTSEAAGVFAVVGTAFAVLLAFVFFLAFQAYDNARNDARTEADAVISLYRTSQLFPEPASGRLRGELACYGRAVIEREWPAMREDRSSPVVQGWIAAMDRTVRGARIAGDKQAVALDHWFEQADVRQEGRRGRLAEAGDVVPALVWFVLLLGGATVIAYACLFADPAERRLSQSLMMFAVSTMVVSSLLVIFFLEHPYEDQRGSIRPQAMRAALRLVDSSPGLAPCDASGRPRRLAS